MKPYKSLLFELDVLKSKYKSTRAEIKGRKDLVSRDQIRVWNIASRKLHREIQNKIAEIETHPDYERTNKGKV